MTLTKWVQDTYRQIKSNGVQGLPTAGYELYLGSLRRLRQLQCYGTNIYEEQWDLLIILDTCRVDILKELCVEYSFLTEINSIQSVGSSSPEWMENTFTEEYLDPISRTHHVTGNVHSQEHLSDLPFIELDEVWRDGWNDERGTVNARTMTDRVIDLCRRKRTNRVIAHYMQPHYPYMRNPELDFKNPNNKKPDLWHKLQQGVVSESVVWNAYRENLRYVLDDLEILLENVDAERVVITADHGEAFGEWYVYEHPGQMPLSVLREVPWCVTSASDEQTYDPDIDRRVGDSAVESKLRDLGYL